MLCTLTSYLLVLHDGIPITSKDVLIGIISHFILCSILGIALGPPVIFKKRLEKFSSFHSEEIKKYTLQKIKNLEKEITPVKEYIFRNILVQRD